MDGEYTTAVHEAGHAVIARVLCLPCGHVSIEPESDNIGHAIVGDPIREWTRGDGPRRPIVECSVISLYAGAEAERCILGTADLGDHCDRHKATSLISIIGVRGASYVGDDIWDRYEEKLRQKGAVLVRLHRSKIERVAATLLAKRILGAAEIDALMGAPTNGTAGQAA